jgi:ketosteroid isomerase-like protein
MGAPPASDREQILEHIHGLFQAFLKGDRETIRRGHTDDWCGFQIGSRSIVRGIEPYMAAADRVLADFRTLDYELTETEVRVMGDVAIACYVSRETLETPTGRRDLRLRAIDVYRREADGRWNQCASNISLLPQ